MRESAGGEGEESVSASRALEFVRAHGVVLASAKGPVPKLSEFIAGEPIKGSWWGHPKGQAIFRALNEVADSSEILSCRLVAGKVTFVHRRLWPALVRAATRFPRERLAHVREEHTETGRHVTHEVPFPKWVPAEVKLQAKKLSLDEAINELGRWAHSTGP
jgi:hypothetical protein